MPSMITHLTPQSVYLVSSSADSSALPTIDYHIFLIPGNPGCVGYYHDFLSLLVSIFEDSKFSGARIHVYGCSAANLVDDKGEDSGKGKILGLKGQIEYFEGKLQDYIEAQSLESDVSDGTNDSRTVKVILVGHSVGAYICMEILRHWKERKREASEISSATTTGNIQSTSIKMSQSSRGLLGVDFIGLLGLWPTITEIAQSPSGRRLGWMLRIPYFPSVVGSVVQVLTRIIHRSTFERIVGFVTRFPKSAAETTTYFLTSSQGVEQALTMAADEMRDITEDRWTDEIWGSAALSAKQHTKLVFYFGKADHWVADHVRDNLISTRGYKEGDEAWKAKMLVDDHEIPHSFCIKHSSTAAGKTVGFLADFIQADRNSLD